MNDAALNKERFEAIEAYLLGKLPVEDKLFFEHEMSRDPALRAEVDLQRENMTAVELGGMDRMLTQLATERSGRPRSSDGARFLKYAAAIAVVFGAAWWFASRPSANERLFAEHWTPDPGLPVPMSATTDHAFHDAMVAYKLGDYHEARSKWSALLKEDPTNDTLRYYIGNAALGAGDATAARVMLEAVGRDTSSSFRMRALWYAYLTTVRGGTPSDSLAGVLSTEPVYTERLRSIEAELER